MQKARLAVFLLLLVGPSFGAGAYQLPGRVLHVIDGDTLLLLVDRAQYRIELAGIDAPELNQPWGKQAADRLQRMLSGAFIVVQIEHIDSYSLTGRITHKGRDTGRTLLLDGLARQTRVVPEALPSDHPYVLAERQARLARRGIWSEKHPSTLRD